MTYQYRFTVFTPTYNRAHTLSRPYESLKKQTYRNFEWLIVDDGSTDNTADLVRQWQAEADFDIRYVLQEHAHKKVAFNRGVREARGELFLTTDSDDAFVATALEVFSKHWDAIPLSQRDAFSAVTALCVTETGDIVGRPFPVDVLDCCPQEARFKHKADGDKWGFQRTDVLKKFPYPEDIAGFVPESLVWNAIGRVYKTRFVNDGLHIVYPSADSLTNRTSWIRNAAGRARGCMLQAQESLCLDLPWFRHAPEEFLKFAANYTRYKLHLKHNAPEIAPLRGAAPTALVGLMWPLGYLLYRRDIFYANKV